MERRCSHCEFWMLDSFVQYLQPRDEDLGKCGIDGKKCPGDHLCHRKEYQGKPGLRGFGKLPRVLKDKRHFRKPPARIDLGG